MNSIKMGVVLLLLCGLQACTQGSGLLLAEQKPPLQSTQVKLLGQLPLHGEIIGLVRATSIAQESAIEELKRQAAKMGANAIVIESFGPAQSNHGGAGSAPVTIEGKAIYLPQSKQP